MTQPAVHGQFRHNTPQDAARPYGQDGVPHPGHDGHREAGMDGATVLPAKPAVSWRKAAVIAASGIAVGLLWWILAPSGLNLLSGNPDLRSGANTEGWLPRDLVLAALFLLAGCISGAVASGSKHAEPSGRDVFLAVGAGVLGTLAAWGTGVLCGMVWGTPEDTSASASIAFSLRSLAVLAIWPASTALAIFLNTVFAAPRPQAGQMRAGEMQAGEMRAGQMDAGQSSSE